MIMRPLDCTVCSLVALVSWSACAADAPSTAARGPAVSSHALLRAPTAVAATLPPAGEGRRLYLALNCYGCHGMFATGAMGPNIVHAETGDLTEAVLEGEDAGMPSFRAYLTATDISNLAAYLQSIGGPNEPTFMDWWVAVPKK